VPVRRLIIAVTGRGFSGVPGEVAEWVVLSGEPFSLAVALASALAGTEISRVLLSDLFFMMQAGFVR
jgi:hypothetical protein